MAFKNTHSVSYAVGCVAVYNSNANISVHEIEANMLSDSNILLNARTHI